MSFESFKKSQMFSRRSSNLIKLGFDFDGDLQEEYLKIQNLLMTRYHIQNGSMITIMKEFGIPSSRTMDILFREFEIEARDLSNATLLSISENRSSPLDNVQSFVHIRHKTWDGKNFLLRSSLEQAFASKLDHDKIVYEVECMRVKYFDECQKKFRIAIPDFYLPRTNEIVEVKSDYWLDEENMKCKAKGYRELGFSFSLFLNNTLIKNWSAGWDSNPLCQKTRD